MYLRHFGLDKEPFKITPDPEFFFAGGNRGAVLEALRYAVARGEGIVKVVGEVGSGKTMLCRMLERELPENCEIVYLANPRLSANEILHAIAFELQLDVPRDASKLEVLSSLQHYLLAKHSDNRQVVMFIEEAQGMHFDTLEEIRMLSNLETTQEKLLQIVLFGQPELDEKLAAHEIRQLKERITYVFDLTPLNRDEIRDYINTRLRASGYRGNELFSRRAVAALARYSKGLSRRINVLSDKALLAAFSCGEHLVSPKHVKMAAKDSDFDTRWTVPRLFAPGVVISGLLVVVAAAVLWFGSQSDFSRQSMLKLRNSLFAHDLTLAPRQDGSDDPTKIVVAQPQRSKLTSISTKLSTDRDGIDEIREITPSRTDQPSDTLLAAGFMTLDALRFDFDERDLNRESLKKIQK